MGIDNYFGTQNYKKLRYMNGYNIFLSILLFYSTSLTTVYVQLTVTCDHQGTLLFREDFGGNSGTVPQRAPNPDWQASGRTTYQYETRTNPLLPDVGHYALLTHTAATGWAHGFGDHTSPSDLNHGYFLTFDATASSGQFYQFDIDNLCDGKILKFSIYMMNINPITYNGVLPNVMIWLENISTGTSIHSFSTGDIPRTASPTWVLYEFAFLIPVNVSNIRVHVVNNVSAGQTNGNDLAIDDIEVKLCTPAVSITSIDSVCLGSTATFNGTFANDGTFSEPLAYQWLKSSTPEIEETTTWIDIGTNSPVLTINNVSTSDVGCYRLAISSANTINYENCRAISEPFCMATKQCQIYDTISVTICANEQYNFYNNWYNTTGIYTDTLHITTELDSIITLILTVNPLNQKTVDTSICFDESYNFYGRILTETGTYSDTISGVDCDTVATLNLTVHPPLHTEITDEICQGDSVFFIDTWLYSTGIYSNTLLSVLGCDSLVSLTLQVPEMAVEISSSNPDFCSTHETVLTAITPNHKTHWNTGDNDPEITVTRHGTYTVTVSELDCKLSAQYRLHLYRPAFPLGWQSKRKTQSGGLYLRLHSAYYGQETKKHYRERYGIVKHIVVIQFFVFLPVDKDNINL
jgi:hypothetical protein